MNLIHKRGKKERKEGLWGTIFVTPQIIGLALFVAFPLICSLIMCFSDWNNLSEAPVFVGFDNFHYVFTDPVFWKSLGNTGLYVLIIVPVTLFIALGLALLTNRKLPLKPLYRAAFFLPMVTSSVAIAMVWRYIYMPAYKGGILNSIIVNVFHGEDVGWLTDPNVGLITVSIISIWLKIGYYYIIFDAGLKNIPKELYEAADIDGASWFTKARRITIPMLSNVAFFVMVMLFIDVFGMFNEARLVGAVPGGADRCMYSLSYYIFYMYHDVISLPEGTPKGCAAVASWVLFMLTGIVTAVQFLFKKKLVYEQ
ncbi:MAG: sugar ABC transporter permease [Bacilli bacterium]|nr:sugar ABC transporter permease [Bacilli bacterium]